MRNSILIFYVTLFFIGTCCYAQSNYVPVHNDTVKNKLDDVVVSGSRLPERYFESTASIDLLQSSELKNTSISTYDAIANTKGVQVITPSLGFQVVNTRGFANTTNVRFAQLVDGIDNQAPHIGAPIANAMGAADLDIENIEVIQGTACAIYGMNALNGMINIHTKDPFKSQGLSFQQLTGINHVGTNDNASIYTRYTIRYAHKISRNVAFKINAGSTNGIDWVADDRTDLGSTLNMSTRLTGSDNPAYDEVNSYGNESPNRKTLSLGGKKYVVARTGYRESEIEDYKIKNYKADGGIYLRMSHSANLSLTVKATCINNIYQRSNRFHLKNYWLSQYAINYESSYFDFRTYLTKENTGKSYNIRSLAENIDRSFKQDSIWFLDYTSAFYKATSEGINIPDAHKYARQVSDDGRFVPGTKEFDTRRKALEDINDWDVGAALHVKSLLYHAEGVSKWNKIFPALENAAKLQLLTGFDYRNYTIIPDGNYFINPVDSGCNINYSKYGGFIQVTKNVLNSRLHTGITLRADKTDYFSWKFNPRIAIVYTPWKNLCLRSSYQSGYRFPSIFEGFSNVNSGGIKRVGGLEIMSKGVFESSYTKVSIDSFQSQVNVDINQNGLTKQQAIDKNKSLLKNNTYTYLQPEHIRSVEAGIRWFALQHKVYFDVDAYYNIYNNFIAQIEASIPGTNNIDSIPQYLYSGNKQHKYRLWTNSKSRMFSYGTAIAVSYRFNKNIQLKGSANFNKLDKTEDKDGLEDGFNTPQWTFHTSLITDNILKNMSITITAHYQSAYNYVSFLVSGKVPPYWSFDAQFHYNARSWLRISIGGTNILNKKYTSILGGPAIGGLYYFSTEIDL